MCWRITGAALLALLATARAGSAQTPSVQQNTEPQHDHPSTAEPQHEHQQGASVVLFSTRDASGTAWLPDVTPMYGFHHTLRGWEAMLHGNAFLQLLDERAPEHRGATQAGSTNWVMAMARRPIGSARVGLRTMVSLEPWTIPGCGYPNLLADSPHPPPIIGPLAPVTSGRRLSPGAPITSQAKRPTGSSRSRALRPRGGTCGSGGRNSTESPLTTSTYMSRTKSSRSGSCRQATLDTSTLAAG